MANRDPAFWKRFSTAVHLDLEHATVSDAGNVRKEQPSWLERQNAKHSRRAWVCCGFWLCLGLFVLGVVATLIWLVNSGTLNKIKIGDDDGTPSQSSNPNGGSMGGD